MTEHMTDRNRWLALVIVCLGYLMIVLDVTIVGVALPSIQDDLGFLGELARVGCERLSAHVRRVPLLVGLGDLFGHRRLFLLGIALRLASLGCGLATSQELLVGARALQASAAQSSRRLRCRSSLPSSPSLRSGRRRWASSVSSPPPADRSASYSAGSDRRPQLALDLPRQRPIGAAVVVLARLVLPGTRRARRASAGRRRPSR